LNKSSEKKNLKWPRVLVRVLHHEGIQETLGNAQCILTHDTRLRSVVNFMLWPHWRKCPMYPLTGSWVGYIVALDTGREKSNHHISVSPALSLGLLY